MQKKKNNFSEEDRMLFNEVWECWFCGSNQANCLHHIVGRGSKNGDCESSPLNACPICNYKCHISNHGLLNTKEWQKKLLNKTYQFLIKSGYIFTSKDSKFLEKYSYLYY